MATYSHSKISAFENCPFQYKLQYIDKIEVETPTTIEAFMGDLVHRTLELMYKNWKFKKRVEKKILIKFYRDLWEKEYSDDILVVKEDEGLKADNYREMGEQYISDYYDSHKNDDMIIIGLETRDRLTLPDGNSWYIRMDKLGCDKEGNYYICDYKTNQRMKTQEEADEDRQLAMYSIWVKDKFKDAKKIILKWHMLAFNKDVTSERTEEQLKKLQEEVIGIIKDIQRAEKEGNFPRKQSFLCAYCLYKEHCPSFKHEIILEKKAEKSVELFKKDDGLKLVDGYAEIKRRLAELQEKEEEFKRRLIEFSKQIGVDAVYGSNSVASIKEFEKIILPEDREEFLTLLKEKGLYDACSMICYTAIQSKFKKGEFKEHKDIHSKIRTEKDWRISLKKKKSEGEE